MTEDGEKLTHGRYADDMILIGKDPTELKVLLTT